MTTELFGARLRHERERRGIALASIADRTKIAPPLLVALERGDLARWPGGLYRRAFMRAYAEAVGLDATELVREFLEFFPDPAQAAPEIAAGGQPVAPGAPAGSASSTVRLRIDPAPHVCRGGSILSETRHRVAAIAADLAILGVTSTGFWLALDDVWMPLAIAMASYYAGGILILGNTPGVCLSAAIAQDDLTRSEASHASHA